MQFIHWLRDGCINPPPPLILLHYDELCLFGAIFLMFWQWRILGQDSNPLWLCLMCHGTVADFIKIWIFRIQRKQHGLIDQVINLLFVAKLLYNSKCPFIMNLIRQFVSKLWRLIYLSLILENSFFSHRIIIIFPRI